MTMTLTVTVTVLMALFSRSGNSLYNTIRSGFSLSLPLLLFLFLLLLSSLPSSEFMISYSLSLTGLRSAASL